MSEKKAWDESYKNKDNFVFYPHEEVVRFFAKYVAKQTGVDSFDVRHTHSHTPKVLDFGCGIGRHVKLANEFKLECYGVDISTEAIRSGKEIFKQMGLSGLSENLIEAQGQKMPFENEYFDYVVSHGVLDSMSFETAKASMAEISRCLKPNALAYIDVVSGDDLMHYPEYAEEEIVKSEHEKNTIQSYFNWSKVNELVDGFFTIEDAVLVKRNSQISRGSSSRYHLVLRKR